MKNKYSKENDELMLVFRGYKRHPTEEAYWVKGDFILNFELKYQSSWDWLMRVVEDIIKFGEKHELRNPFIKSEFITDHQKVYLMCVDFIKRYNRIYGINKN